MKVTLNWLKEFVDIDLSAHDVAETLTMLGLEVEEVRPLTRNFSGVVTALVESVEPHPSAQKLTVCRVHDGHTNYTVVCGAPNVQAGAKYPLAKPGAKLGELTIERRDLRGVFSEGMLCSEAELGISERADGLMVLPDDTVPGVDLNLVLGEPDTLLDVFITPNRADCLSVIGIARELAAATRRTLRRPTISLDAGAAAARDRMQVVIDNPKRCGRYTGRLVKNVTAAPSPRWLAERLHAVGIRSINNIVDITNYVMMETGQPLHAFDFARLEGGKIVVRTAQEGERFITLDDQEHTLNQEALLICDGQRPVALAGIMGGQNSEVSESTADVFLESAYFEPTGIRITSAKLGLASESSRRFEKGVDPNGVLYALDRAAQLLVDIAGGQVVGEAVDVYPQPFAHGQLNLSIERSNALLGTRLSVQETAEILRRLEIETTIIAPNELTVRVPTFRVDLTRPVDLMEEIARCFGYNSIEPVAAPPINLLQEANPRDLFRDKIRQILAGAGFKETVAYNLASRKTAEALLPVGKTVVQVLNPLSTDLAVFRPNIILSLLGTAAYNRNRQIPNLRLFEIGQSAWAEADGHQEHTQIGGLLAGERVTKSWNEPAALFDFYDIKGAVEHLLQRADVETIDWCAPQEGFWDTEAAGITVGGAYAGAYGRVKRDICGLVKLKGNDIFAFWLDFNVLYDRRRQKKQYDPVPRFPAVPFDLALLVDDQIEIGRIEKAIHKAGQPYLRRLRLFDFYRGEQVGVGKKSIAFSLTFSSKERTLSEDEVSEAIRNILDHLKAQFGAELRPS